MARAPKTQAAKTAAVYQQLPITDLTGGLDLRSAHTLMASDRARALTNWTIEQPGALSVAPGHVQFSTSSLGSGRMQGAARIYLNTALPSANSTRFTVVGYDGKLYQQTDSGGWVSTTAHLSGLSSANELHFAHDRDLVAVFDGSTRPWKSTNGSSWTKMGLLSGTSAMTASSVSSGSLSSAEFEFSYTYKDRDLVHESNGSTARSTITLGATGAIKLVIPNSTEAAADAIVVYGRNKTAGESIRRKASSIAMSAGTHSTIIIESSNWTSNDEEPSDHDVPGLLSFGVVWKNRWWGRDALVKNRLRFTQLFQPQSWPTLFYLDIPFERGDEIRALVPIGDSLIVFGYTGIFVIHGQTSLDFEVRPTLSSQDGAFGPRAVAAVETGIVHAGRRASTTSTVWAIGSSPTTWRRAGGISCVTRRQRISTASRSRITNRARNCAWRSRADIRPRPPGNGCWIWRARPAIKRPHGETRTAPSVGISCGTVPKPSQATEAGFSRGIHPRRC